MLRIIAFKLEESLLQKIDVHAQLLGISRSELIRRALYAYLSLLERRAASGRSAPLIKKMGGRGGAPKART